MPTYTYANLRDDINERLHQKIAVVSDVRAVINNVIRKVNNKIDLRTTKRRMGSPPNLFSDIYTYAAPADLKQEGLIDVRPQKQPRSTILEWGLTTPEEFDRRKTFEDKLIAIQDEDAVKKLLISLKVDDSTLLVSPLDNVLDNNTNWVGFGDGENLTTDTSNFIEGNGSINWDISAAGGTTAGIQNPGLRVYDLTTFRAAGTAFVWAYLTSPVDVTDIRLRLGNDSSNYIEMTATSTHEMLTFQTGWQLLSFNLFGALETGTVTNETCTYAAIYMTKDPGKISETDYRFDHIVLKLGDIHNVIYYSKFYWQDISGIYKENSTFNTDILNAEQDEYDMYLEKGVEILGLVVRETQDAQIAKENFRENFDMYRRRFPSEAILKTNIYHDFAGIDGEETNALFTV